MAYPVFSILHISDLHKDADASYDQLLASLEDDRVTWRNGNPTILEPSFIVVSGDLIQGCELNMTKKAATESLDRQYAEVEAFLAALADRFLNGDRNRIIIVPGNHDVSRNASQRSMAYVDEKERDAVYKTFVNSRGKSCLYRWSWKDFAFCKIVKDDIYKERFDAYLRFYNRFYHGVREELKDCVDNVETVDFPDFNITFACYNSCADLDHLNETGRISNAALYCKREELQESYADELADRIKRNSTVSNQKIERDQIDDVAKIVQTADTQILPQPGTPEAAQMQAQENLLEPMPSIMRQNIKTDAKLLETSEDSPLLHNYKRFLSVTPKMYNEYLSFFFYPHTTRVIWSMHRIIYIFSLRDGMYNLYYDMELTKHIDSNLTGGMALFSTTIITKNKLFIPVPPPLYEYFIVKEDPLKFSIRCYGKDGSED